MDQEWIYNPNMNDIILSWAKITRFEIFKFRFINVWKAEARSINALKWRYELTHVLRFV